MLEIIAVVTITIFAVISPGADFAMVTRNSLLYGRRAGLLTSAGIATGVQLHVLYSMLGVALLLRSSPGWFWAIKLAGAAYLVYVGWQTFVSRISPGAINGNAWDAGIPARTAFKAGFFTNALNPKTTLFVVSVYAQAVGPDTPVAQQIAYGLFMSLAHLLWFSGVSIFLSDMRLRTRLLKHQVLLNRCIGVVLVGLGLALAFGSSGE
ncbi:LysE family translocator [Comamonas nitrativorans]|uniref:LysE family translocator n=1 Tax=Comamonas nitrativorans TaxID=108437 RepID=A0ABV9H1C8_9BURK